MADAQNLEDLLRIRDHQRAVFDGNPGVLGTALGVKNGTGPPSVLVFVKRKIRTKWLKNSPAVPPRLSGPGSLACPSDVIETSETAFDQLRGIRLLSVSRAGMPEIVRSEDLFGYTDLNDPAKHELLSRLRGATDKITPGSRLYFTDAAGDEFSGTLACFAERGGQLGVLTNKHIGESLGNKLFFPELNGTEVGTVAANIGDIESTRRFPIALPNAAGHYTVDAGFVSLSPNLAIADIDFELPVVREGSLSMQQLGAPLPFDLKTMGPIGAEVIGVGQMRSHQRGQIAAFAYEWARDPEQSVDYLIRGVEGGDEFSDAGDSGKLIVTADGLRPVALLWGGGFERLRHRYGLENWSYATEINFALGTLNAKIRSA